MSCIHFIAQNYKLGTALVVFVLVSTFQCSKPDEHPRTTSLKKACAYLWEAQAPDGGWHSETHGILRSGESITPFIFVALMNVSPDVYKPSQQKIHRAKDFIRKNIRSKINSDSLPKIIDYPNYTAAYALKGLSHSSETEDSMLISYLTTYLLVQQFIEHRGIDSLNPAYGGWGFGEVGLQYGTTGHVDISHTRRVLEALRLTLPADHSAFRNAQKYLARVQNDDSTKHSIPRSHLDGGFFTSIVTPETNKSLPVSDMPDTWHSYATATCDGLLALHAAVVPHNDSRMEQASAWLRKHSELSFPVGIPLDDPLQWHLVMKYYHLAVRGEVCAFVNGDDVQRQKISAILVAEQRDDGSFMNPMGASNKEDDPLLATAFAIIAMNPVRLH